MRVLSGTAKGRRLKGPAISGARPTSELVRGAIFNILGPLDAFPVRALDLFAGTGSLGIEALSRGAQQADFVERDPSQCARVRENLALTGFQGNATVYCVDVRTAMKSLNGPYQLVLMDPPYELQTVGSVLQDLASSALLDPGARVMVGHSKRVSLEEEYLTLVRRAIHRYGDSMVDLFQKEA